MFNLIFKKITNNIRGAIYIDVYFIFVTVIHMGIYGKFAYFGKCANFRMTYKKKK